MSLKIDLKDKKILYYLDINSRQSNAEIAKKVGLSKDIVNYRIKKLEKNKIIKGYYTVINFALLGKLSVRLYLKFFDTTLEKEKEMFEFLKNNKTVFFLADIDGTFDIALGTWVEDIYEFEEFYNSFKQKFKKYMGEEQISVFTRTHHFHRVYLLNKQFDELEPEIWGGTKLISHDDLDINILKLLASNSRIPLIELAKKLKTPSRTIAFRINQLEKKKIIQGYRFIFDFNSFGYKYFKLDIMLNDVSRIKEMINYARVHPNIIYVNEVIGGYDFEIDVEVKSKDDLLSIVNELKLKFPEIRYWNYFTAKKYLKLLYFPES